MLLENPPGYGLIQCEIHANMLNTWVVHILTFGTLRTKGSRPMGCGYGIRTDGVSACIIGISSPIWFASYYKLSTFIKSRTYRWIDWQHISYFQIILFWVPPIIVEKMLIEPDRDRCGNCEISYNRSLVSWKPDIGLFIAIFILAKNIWRLTTQEPVQWFTILPRSSCQTCRNTGRHI